MMTDEQVPKARTASSSADHANELRRHADKIGRPAGDTPAVMQAAAAHIEHLERDLRAAEIRLHDVATHCATVEAELAEIKRRTYVAVTCNHVARMERAEARVAELEAERAEREKQDPAAYLTADKNMLVFADKCVDMKHLMTPLYADPPVTAQAEGYVTALRYIAWEAAGYMDCVHAAKRAIGEAGALPPPPKIQPAKGRD